MKVLLCSVIFVLGALASAGEESSEGVKLEYKYRPGLELHYTLTGTMTELKSPQHTFAGKARILVCQLDSATGVALLASFYELVDNTKGAESATEHRLSVSRVQSNGKAILHELKGDLEIVGDLLKPLQKPVFFELQLPPTRTQVGQTWNGGLHVVVGGYELPASHTLAEIKSVDGKQHAVIKAAAEEREQREKTATAEAEYLFDVDGGVVAQQQFKYESLVRSKLKIQVEIKLDKCQRVAAEAVALESACAKRLYAILPTLFDGDIDTALAECRKERAALKDKVWQEGLDYIVERIEIVNHLRGRLEEVSKEAQARIEAEVRKQAERERKQQAAEPGKGK